MPVETLAARNQRIIAMHSGGMSQMAIARQCGISRASIGKIVKKRQPRFTSTLTTYGVSEAMRSFLYAPVPR